MNDADTSRSDRSGGPGPALPKITMLRAIVVSLGPSAVLDIFMAASTAAMARAWVTGWRPNRATGWLMTIGASLPWIYGLVIRPWHRAWGATEEERRMPLPGDVLAHQPGYQHTRAVTIHAPADEVWRWLAQVGQGRGGFYSYDWLENLAGCDIHNADRIHAEWQNPRAGDTVAVVQGWGPRLLEVEPGRSLVIEGWGGYAVRPIDAHSSRLMARARHPQGWGLLGYALLVEIPHFIMERKMLLGLRDRAERAAGGRTLLDTALPEYQYAGSVAIRINAAPAAIFRALREVTLADMPMAHALGAIRYLPGRLAGRMPEDSESRSRPFFEQAARLVIAEEPEREVVIGGIGRLHDLLDQQFVDLEDAEAFRRFRHPDYEKHAESFRITGGDPATGYILLAEHRTQALGPSARWKFALYWYVLVGWASNLLLRMLLEAVKRRAEQVGHHGASRDAS